MEIWEAQRIDKIMDAGRTHPLVVECVGPQPENRERRSFILKALALPEIRETSLFYEIFGNLLARKVGIDTPEPVLVHLSPVFVETSRSVIANHAGLVSKGAKLLPGYGAGCEFFSPGFAPVVPGSSLTEDELAQATRIYAFDLMVQNIDRSFESDRRPNCAHWGRRLIAYDFEMCFSFVLSIFNPHKAWEVSRHGLNAPHVFYLQLRDALRSSKLDFSPFIKGVKALDIEELVQIMQELPEGWTQFAGKIEAHLREIVANIPAFELELYRSLA